MQGVLPEEDLVDNYRLFFLEMLVFERAPFAVWTTTPKPGAIPGPNYAGSLSTCLGWS